MAGSDDDDLEWDFAPAMFTGYSDGFLTVQVLGAGAGSTTEATQVSHTFGFVSRPRDPDVDASGNVNAGSTVVYAWEGARQVAWFDDDPRVTPRLPRLVKGSSLQYAILPDGQLSYIRLSGSDGSLDVYVPGQATGSYISLTDAGGLDINTPYGRIQLGPSGYHVKAGGARFSMNQMAGLPLPAPFDQLSSRATISAAFVNIDAICPTVGTDGGAANGLAVQQLQTFLTSLVAAIATITTSTPGAAAMAPIEAQLPALFTILNGLGKAV